MRRVDALGRQRTQERLALIEALVAAQERRQDVMDAVATSEDVAEAVPRLMTLLGLTEAQVTVVLDMQVRRWTAADRRGYQAERDELRALLDKQ